MRNQLVTQELRLTCVRNVVEKNQNMTLDNIVAKVFCIFALSRNECCILSSLALVVKAHLVFNIKPNLDELEARWFEPHRASRKWCERLLDS